MVSMWEDMRWMQPGSCTQLLGAGVVQGQPTDYAVSLALLEITECPRPLQGLLGSQGETPGSPNVKIKRKAADAEEDRHNP